MLVALVIIGREITVSALREWMARVGESGKVKVNWFGKIKAIAQMVSIPMLLYLIRSAHGMSTLREPF